jgi:uncharacterized OB-fold protein
MQQKSKLPAIEGWYAEDDKGAHLIGSRCTECGTYYFPKQSLFCKSPHCPSESFEEVPLSRTGTIWSYTDAQYQPPEPYVAADPYEPFTIAAVELEHEKMIVLGQAISGVQVSDLKVGMPVELVLDTLYEDDETEKTIWKWQPAKSASE